MKLKPGQYVRHSQYGWGTILERDGGQTMVYFLTVGVKKFATSLTTFAVVPRVAPQIGKGFSPHYPGRTKTDLKTADQRRLRNDR
jgi:hypothetical protein